MKIEQKTWPGEKAASKDDIERLYRMAYCVDPGYFKKEDVVNLGLDLYRLKEFGQVRMSKPLSVLRRQAPALWKRLSDVQKSAYVLSDIVSGLRYVDEAVTEFEKLMGEFPEAHEHVDFIYNQLFVRLPADVKSRLEKGFGKWKVGG